MVNPGFTEFSYGFALTLEIVNDIRVMYPSFRMHAPEFPSLIDEGAGKGYDVALSGPSRPFFIQFKLSNYLKGGRSKGRISGKYSAPYYSFKLRSNPSNQHSDLLRLESSGEEVYYAAPFFHLQREFNAYFIRREIFERSIFIRPSTVLSPADGLNHEFCFDGKKNYLFSEPIQIEAGLRRANFLSSLIQGERNEFRTRNYEEIFNNILDAARLDPQSEMAATLKGSGEDFVLASARAARLLLGTNMLLLTREEIPR